MRSGKQAKHALRMAASLRNRQNKRMLCQTGRPCMGGLFQGDPDETVGSLHIVTDVLDRNIGQFLAILVGDAIDQHDC